MTEEGAIPSRPAMNTYTSQGKDHKVVADQENTAQNSVNQGKEYYEHIAEHYYPEDFEDTDLEGDDLKEMVCNEIDYIIADWDPSADGFNYCSEDWEDARDIIQAYMDVLDANGIEVPGWVIEGINERNAEFNV